MRAALYARVSSEEQVEGYSIDAQRRAFRSLCESRGWTPYHEYIEEGKSARTDNMQRRPVFRKAMEDALSHQFDVLVVHKLDRFSRNLRITLEYFDKLSKAGIAFVSINEQMDFSTPWGRLALTLLGGLAQFYSDNLSQETKKGWHERRKQGLYCGLLPFGAIKGEDGVPVPDPNTHPGLVMAFELAALGKSDREVAEALNARGYRTSGNQGNGPFSKDTLRGILQNRFYLGYVADGDEDWIKGKHQPFIDEQLFVQAQESRQRNRRSPRNHPAKATVSSLSGLAFCWYCKGRIHTGTTRNGKKRMMCASRSQGKGCQQKSALLEVYEPQIEEYLQNFQIPEDYQEKILDAHHKLKAAYDETQKLRAELQARLERNKRLFKWGDVSEQDYLAEKTRIQQELTALTPTESDSNVLERLASFLRNVACAWKEANQEQRNTLGRQLFEEVWLKDKQVIAVRPRPEFEAFFRLSFDEWRKQFESAGSNPLGVASNVCYATPISSVSWLLTYCAAVPTVISPPGIHTPACQGVSEAVP
jgi:site-specific DNA recombinase